MFKHWAIRIPDVFANGHTTGNTSDLNSRILDPATFEVAILVKGSVVRETILAVCVDNATTMTNCSRVVQNATTCIHETDHCRGVTRGGGETLEQRLVVLHKTRFQDEVLRRIAGNGEFWIHHHIDPRPGSPCVGRFKPHKVSVEVTDGLVQLGQGNSHPFSIAPAVELHTAFTNG